MLLLGCSPELGIGFVVALVTAEPENKSSITYSY